VLSKASTRQPGPTISAVYRAMWYRMANEQRMYDLSDRLIRSINSWQSFGSMDDDVEELIEQGVSSGFYNAPEQ